MLVPPFLLYIFLKVSLHLVKFQEEKGCWLWKRPQPESKKLEGAKSEGGTEKIRIVRKVKTLPVKDRLTRGTCSLDSPVKTISTLH